MAWKNPFSFLIPRLLFPAILGMYTLMSNKQYYDAICSGEICNTEGISSEYVWEPRALGRQYQVRGKVAKDETGELGRRHVHK